MMHHPSCGILDLVQTRSIPYFVPFTTHIRRFAFQSLLALFSLQPPQIFCSSNSLLFLLTPFRYDVTILHLLDCGLLRKLALILILFTLLFACASCCAPTSSCFSRLYHGCYPILSSRTATAQWLKHTKPSRFSSIVYRNG
jgi:hypothetical protein